MNNPLASIPVVSEFAGPQSRVRASGPCAVIIFGASGDLTRRKLIPALYQLARQRLLAPAMRFFGFARSMQSAEEMLGRYHEALKKSLAPEAVDDAAWSLIQNAFEAIQGGYDDPRAYERLAARLHEPEIQRATGGNRLFYLATPAEMFPVILRQLHESGLTRAAASRGVEAAEEPWARVIIEKPFGRDLNSARELNRLVAEMLDEKQTYRIDHYLGKETVQNILVFRFGNSIFEPVWNRKHIDHVQITASEEIGIGNRGAFYEQTGVLRDIIQNHLLQVLALCAMEQPVTFGADEIRDEKAKVFRSLRMIQDEEVHHHVVCGQYRGYREEPHVAADSRTPTYAALRVMIDNWRWNGVPFYLRAGKRLARRTTEIAIVYQTIPFCLFGRDEVCQRLEPNVLTLRIQPDEGIALRFASKIPAEDFSVGTVRMDFSYKEAFHRPTPEAYERLLLDCMRGDATLFARRDEIEKAWEFMTPIIHAVEANPAFPVATYEPGSDGPAEAKALLARDGRHWRKL